MQIEARRTLGIKPEIILIVCEDEKSSAYYLEDKVKSVGIPIVKSIEKIKLDKSGVEIKGLGATPLTIVKKAIERKELFKKVQKYKSSIPYSKIFCVMDVDDHEQQGNQLTRALQAINDENKKDNETELIPIISNECFELWYVLHFDYTTAELYRNTKRKRGKNKEYIDDKRNLSKLIEKHLNIKKYDKGHRDIFELLQKNGNEKYAIINSKKLNRHHLNVNKITEDEIYKHNPSTQVFKLIIALNELGVHENPHDFKELQSQDISQINCSEIGFVKKLWKLLFEHYYYLGHIDRFNLLKEAFLKPYNNKVFREIEKVRELLCEYYMNNKEK